MKYFGAMTLLSVFVACSDDNIENTSYLNVPIAVHITATIGNNVITRSYPTDDKNQTNFKEGDEIFVRTDKQYNDGVTYKLTNNSWIPQNNKYLKWEDTKLDFEACYPVNNKNVTDFDVSTSQNTLEGIEKADYMTYRGDITKSESINLTLKRQMARVVISNITFLGQYESGYSVCAIQVHGNTSGYKNGNTKNGEITVDAYKSDDGKFYALLSPITSNPESTFLTVTIQKDNTPPDSVSLKVKGIPLLTANNSYNYSLTVGKDLISVSSVTVKDWNNGGAVIDNNGEGTTQEEHS